MPRLAMAPLGLAVPFLRDEKSRGMLPTHFNQTIPLIYVTINAMSLNNLRKLFASNNDEHLFPCIRDLVANGLDLERFTDGDRIPSRQDITHYIAAWSKYVGLSSDECLEWMSEYCISVLSAISSSSKSQIRHSTKGIIKYIYKSDFTFNCLCEKNRFKATCDSKCSIYDEMSQIANRNETLDIVESHKKVNDHLVSNEIVPQKRSIKDEHKEQFDKALEVARYQLKQGVSKKEIVSLLNDRGFKTRTGRDWSYSILGIELNKLKSPFIK